MLRASRVVAALFLILGLGVERADAAAINLTTPGDHYISGSFTLGFEFQVTEQLTATSLGVYDLNQDGLPFDASVGLWLADGTLLSSVTVPAGVAGSLDGLFRYADIAPILLLPGTNYVVGAFLQGSCGDCIASSLLTGEGGTGTVDPRVLLVRDRYSNFDFQFGFPGSTDNTAGAWLGANLRFDSAAVPEPGILTLLGAGLIAATVRRRTGRRTDA